MRPSMMLLTVGIVFMLIAGGLMLWEPNADIGVATGEGADEPLRRLSEIARALGGIGAVLAAIGIFRRARGF